VKSKVTSESGSMATDRREERLVDLAVPGVGNELATYTTEFERFEQEDKGSLVGESETVRADLHGVS
jgi:hypothetical protein